MSVLQLRYRARLLMSITFKERKMRSEFYTCQHGSGLSPRLQRLLAQDNEDIEIAQTQEERDRRCAELAAKAEALSQGKIKFKGEQVPI